MELQVGLNGHHLRKTLNIMFPSAYITLYHRPPNSACSPLLLRAVPIRDNNGEQAQPAFEVSSEPSSRSSISYLCQFLESSLIEHQAKSTGLCPVRRAIYDQCFDELIRSITIGCIEQGSLLFRVRNELKLTMHFYRTAYESGVLFGLNKAIRAEQETKQYKEKIITLETLIEKLEKKCQRDHQLQDLNLKNRLDAMDKSVEYYENQLAIKDKIIERQRATILAISRDCASNIQGPPDTFEG